jgi:hypothetical protein
MTSSESGAILAFSFFFMYPAIARFVSSFDPLISAGGIHDVFAVPSICLQFLQILFRGKSHLESIIILTSQRDEFGSWAVRIW